MTKVRRYERGDFIALLAGIVSIGLAVWGLPMRVDDAQLTEPIGGAWGFFAGAGVLALVSVFLAQRARSTARGLLVLAGFVLFVGTVVLWEIGWATRISTLVLGLAMMASSATVGRVRT